MKYLVVLVFGAGIFGLSAMALFFFLRFLLLTWAVHVIGDALRGIWGFVGNVFYAVTFVFGPAVLGASIVGLGLQIVMNFATSGGADPTMPVLIALLAFFVIIAMRASRWRARRNRRIQVTAAKDWSTTNISRSADYPENYEGIAHAWERALTLAPEHRDTLLDARAICAALLVTADRPDNVSENTVTETATLIRDHLPTLVDSTERQLRVAGPSGKAEIIDEMMKFLQGFAHRAQRDMRAENVAVERQDSDFRARLASQLFR